MATYKVASCAYHDASITKYHHTHTLSRRNSNVKREVPLGFCSLIVESVSRTEDHLDVLLGLGLNLYTIHYTLYTPYLESIFELFVSNDFSAWKHDGVDGSLLWLYALVSKNFSTPRYCLICPPFPLARLTPSQSRHTTANNGTVTAGSGGKVPFSLDLRVRPRFLVLSPSRPGLFID